MELIAILAVSLLVGVVIFDFMERRRTNAARINRESWEVLQASKAIRDEATMAIAAMFEEARRAERARRARELGDG